jgi:hypothetical protein
MNDDRLERTTSATSVHPRWEELSPAEAAAWLIRNEWGPEEAGLGEQARGLEV